MLYPRNAYFNDTELVTIIKNTFAILATSYIFDNEAYISDLQNALFNCIKTQLLNKPSNSTKTEYLKFLQSRYKTIKQGKKLTLIESQEILKGINEAWRDENKSKKARLRKLSGYNLFYKQNIQTLMKTKPDNICIMKHISNEWNSLPIFIKKSYDT